MEILAALVVMSVLIWALMTGLFSLIVASDSHRKVVQSGLEVTTIAEAIERAPYLPCGTLDDYLKVIELPASSPSGLMPSLAGIKYLESNCISSVNFVTGCVTRVVKSADPSNPSSGDVVADVGGRSGGAADARRGQGHAG